MRNAPKRAYLKVFLHHPRSSLAVSALSSAHGHFDPVNVASAERIREDKNLTSSTTRFAGPTRTTLKEGSVGRENLCNACCCSILLRVLRSPEIGAPPIRSGAQPSQAKPDAFHIVSAQSLGTTVPLVSLFSLVTVAALRIAASLRLPAVRRRHRNSNYIHHAIAYSSLIRPGHIA
ncbi:hypothetical protein F5Y14DRAFT_238210 [Nemania sp. NC0429]|nr:hypothetical protein F5Y14DRAFT_238210 [Nemania sp. NC0429]